MRQASWGNQIKGVCKGMWDIINTLGISEAANGVVGKEIWM